MHRGLLLAIFCLGLFTLSSCGELSEPQDAIAPAISNVMESASISPPASTEKTTTPVMNGEWAEYASIYKTFYLKNFVNAQGEDSVDFCQYIYYLSLLDLDQNSIPELLIYLMPFDMVGYPVAVYTIENEEILCFSEPVMLANINLPYSKNASGLFITAGTFTYMGDKYDEGYYPSTFFCYTDTKTHKNVFLLESRQFSDNSVVSNVYLFTQEENCLAAKSLFECASCSEYTDSEEDAWYIEGIPVSKEYYEQAQLNWIAERDTRYTFNDDINYSDFIGMVYVRNAQKRINTVEEFFIRFG